MKRIQSLIFILLIFLSACASKAAAPQIAPEPAVSNGVDRQTLQQPPAAPSMGVGSEAKTLNSSVAPAQDRIVIQTVDMSIVVKDPQAKMTAISAMALKMGGFVVSSNLTQKNLGNLGEVPEASMTIRVPVKSLEDALAQIKTDSLDVPYENRNGEDVTDKYVDLQSQLKAKQAAADKLYQILDQTVKAEDTLMVFNQLSQVQSDIEVLKGQINYYEQSSALSAISVRLVAEKTIQPLEIAGWQPQGVARDALQSLVDFFQNFVNFLIWLVIFILPVVLILLGLLALLWRLLRWFLKKIAPKKEPPAPKAE